MDEFEKLGALKRGRDIVEADLGRAQAMAEQWAHKDPVSRHGHSWREAAEALQAVLAVLDKYAEVVRERDECIKQLAQCYHLSGADPDYNEDWRLAPDAVQEVAELRKQYDELEDENERLREELKACESWESPSHLHMPRKTDD